MRRSAWLRRTLAEVADGVRSAAEGDLRDLIRAAGLPAADVQRPAVRRPDFLAVPDAWWPDAGVAVEVESREWHLSPEDWERTLRRHARMSAQGIIVMHFTPQPDHAPSRPRVAADIRAALEAGRARPALAIRTLPADRHAGRGGLPAARTP